jgi:arylsulfatase A-like enzyme/tetratricopeptide (TPR) repeat protein
MVAMTQSKIAAVSVTAALFATSCGWLLPTEPPPTARHLVLVTIDTLRADRLGVYGNREVSTPHMDLLAKEGAMAPDATVHAPLTRPSHVSLFTGLLPSEHGIRDNVSPTLDPEIPLLAEVLKTAGFHTAAFISSVVLEAQSGLDRGFDLYSDEFEGADGDDTRFLGQFQKRGDVVTSEAFDWLESNRTTERVCAWIHLYDPHDPYEPPEPYATEYADRLYDGEVAWSDELIGRLDTKLEELGLRDDTLLIVTSDHGEGLGDHGETLHGFFIYQSTLAVPLFFRGPGVVPGARLTVTARTVDLFPTILDLLGVGTLIDIELSGRSLAPALRGTDDLTETTSYAETLIPLLHFGWSDLRSLREGRWKYIAAPRPELYDLEEDPAETRNLLNTESSKAEALHAELARILEKDRAASGSAPGLGEVPLDLLEKLGALGYVGGGGTAIDSSGADPKDKIEEFRAASRLLREGLSLFREKDVDGSIERFQRLLGLVDSFEARYYLGRSLLAAKRYQEAEAHFERALEYQPGYAAAWEALAECRAATGDVRGAIAALQEGQSAIPDDAGLRKREAGVWRQLKNLQEARRAYETAVSLAPADALVRVQLGELLRDMGELDESVRFLREAVAIDSETASYWNSLGTVLGGNGDLAEAVKAFREARRLDESNAQYCYNLGLALLRLGRTEEARRLFQTTLQLNPKFEAARIRIVQMGS